MLIFINAFKSITRSKGRNILIGIIVLTIAVSSSIALAIRSAADTAKESGLDSQTITGTIAADRQKMMESVQGGSGTPNMVNIRELMQQYGGLSIDEQLAYADSEYVKDFLYTASASLSAGGELEPYSTESVGDSGYGGPTGGNRPNGGGFQMGGGGMVIGMAGLAVGDFTVTGYSSESAMTRFISGQSQITDGEMFDVNSSDLNCLISNELAVFNGLSVGDSITLINPGNEEEAYVFKITGIYTNAPSADTGSQMRFLAAMDPANLICTSCGAIDAIVAQSALSAVTSVNEYGMETSTELMRQTSGTYVFSSKANYESFEAELASKGLSEYYVLSSSDINSYEAALVPLENLSSFALTLLLIILAVGAVILIVLNIFNIRERKYEVGVLTAIGIKKSKVAAQFVTELLSVTLVAIIIGTGIGAAVSVPVSNSLLESQVASQETAQSNQDQNFGRQGGGGLRTQGGGAVFLGAVPGGAGGPVDYIDTVNATIDLGILGQLIGIGVLLTIFSSLVGIIFVLRYDPLKILANRS